MENMGAETAHNIEVIISANDPFIEVVDNSGTLDELSAGVIWVFGKFIQY